jgi:hypothetical protein
MNKTLEILSYIFIISVLVTAFAGIYNLLYWHWASYTLALAVAVISGCLYFILDIIRKGIGK